MSAEPNSPWIEQREQAGLERPGTSGWSSKLRVPGTPVRTPTTPTLAPELMDNGASSKESLAELWSNFLEQESQAGHDSAAKSGNQGPSNKPWSSNFMHYTEQDLGLVQGIHTYIHAWTYEEPR